MFWHLVAGPRNRWQGETQPARCRKWRLARTRGSPSLLPAFLVCSRSPIAPKTQTVAMPLEYPRNETLRMPHVFDIRLADGPGKRLLLDAHPIQVAQHYAYRQSEKASPVCHRQPDAQHGQECSTVGGVANKAIRAAPHHGLLRGYGYIARKIVPQRSDGVPAQHDTQEHQYD